MENFCHKIASITGAFFALHMSDEMRLGKLLQF